MNLNEVILFDDKTLADLAKEVYTTTKKKDKKIQEVIDDIILKIVNKSDYAALGISLSEMYKNSINNDEKLLKLAVIVQRLTKDLAGKNANEGDFGLTEDEKKQLLEEAKTLMDSNR